MDDLADLARGRRVLHCNAWNNRGLASFARCVVIAISSSVLDFSGKQIVTVGFGLRCSNTTFLAFRCAT
jgi:hypothetical protein